MADKFEAVEAITPVGRVEWCELKEASDPDDQGKRWYKVTLSWPKSYMDNELKPLRQAAAKAAKAKWGDIPRALQPFIRDGDNVEHNTTDNEALFGRVYLTGKAKETSRPDLVGPNPDVILDPLELYSGAKARMSLLLGGYENKGKKGLWARMQNVQKAGDGERVTKKPKANSQFDRLAGADDSDDDEVLI